MIFFFLKDESENFLIDKDTRIYYFNKRTIDTDTPTCFFYGDSGRNQRLIRSGRIFI